MRRLAQAGFKRTFVRAAILPDWWDDACEQDQNLLPDTEIRVARFLDLPLASVQDPRTALVSPTYPAAQLRRVRDLTREKVAPAIHSALKIAAATARSLRGSPVPKVPPADGLAWRHQIRRAGTAVTLDDLVADLWARGIPVIPVDVLPAPSFQGLACVVEGRPVILLGHKHDEPGRVAYFIAHEVGHIAAGDCTPDQPVVDEDEEVSDEAEMELRAERYAARVLGGSDDLPSLEGADFKELASRAFQLERTTGADAGAIIFAWAHQTGDYANATMAVKALYRGSGARRKLRQYFDAGVDLDAARETDRALLRCAYGEAERDATAA